MPIPVGLCQCGCGRPTGIARRTNSCYGHIRGQPLRYIVGHGFRGKGKPPLERFWAKVEKGSDCWNWTAARTNSGLGYGHFFVRGRWIRTHRFSWTVAFGEIPKGRMVLHKCNNKLCVRPDHLYLGNAEDNQRDRIASGNGNQGERHPLHRLTADIVRQIRSRHHNGEKAKDLAREFGIGSGHLCNIIHRRLWKCVD